MNDTATSEQPAEFALSSLGLSENERHALAHARYQVDRATPDNPDCCFDYELVRTLIGIIERSLSALPSEAVNRCLCFIAECEKAGSVEPAVAFELVNILTAPAMSSASTVSSTP